VNKVETNNIPARLVLSGGGSRGIAHLGIVSALLEIGVVPTAYSGTSAGAVAAAFLCNGYHPEEILTFMLAQKPIRLASTAFSSGLLSTRKLEKFFDKLLPAAFEDLKLPLAVVATDLISGTSITFSKGDLIPVLGGSCAVPGLFRPVTYGNYMLVDGGLLNNMPIEAIPEADGKLIGVHVNPVSTVEPPPSAFRILERSFHLGVYSNTMHRALLVDCYIEPPALAQYRVFDFSNIRQVYMTGYEYVHENKKQVLDQLSD
jgi:NTE family protein